MFCEWHNKGKLFEAMLKEFDTTVNKRSCTRGPDPGKVWHTYILYIYYNNILEYNSTFTVQFYMFIHVIHWFYSGTTCWVFNSSFSSYLLTSDDKTLPNGRLPSVPVDHLTSTVCQCLSSRRHRTTWIELLFMSTYVNGLKLAKISEANIDITIYL